MQATIDIIISVIGERTVHEFTPALKVTPNYHVYGVYVCEGELEVMNIHEGWNKLTYEHGKYHRFVMQGKDWIETDTVQEYEAELDRKLYEYFLKFSSFSEPRRWSDYDEASNRR